MKFSEALILSIRKSEIPLRFEPGAEEAVAQPVTEFIRLWLQAHEPDNPAGDFEYGQQALLQRLLEEVDDKRDLPE